MALVKARDGARLVRSNVRCTCGATLCERLTAANRDVPGLGCAVRLRFICQWCSYYVWRSAFDHGRSEMEDPETGRPRRVTKKDVLVLQHVCADTGVLLPDEVEIFVWAQPAIRDGSRGGVCIEPAHLTRALEERDEGRAIARAGRST